MNKLWKALLVIGACFAVAAPVSVASAGEGMVDPPMEAYPPSDVVVLIDPLACDATTITGVVEVVKPGSSVTVSINPSTTVTADANGRAVFSLNVAPGTYGTFTITATGIKTDGSPFSESASVTLVECAPLPETGTSNTGTMLMVGAAAVMLGSTLVVGALRRRRPATAG